MSASAAAAPVEFVGRRLPVHKSTGADRRAELGGLRCGIAFGSFAVEARETTRAIEDGEVTVGIFVHPHGGAHIVLAMALRRNLQTAPVPAHAVVGADDA